MKNLIFLGDSITDCFHSFEKDHLGRGYVRMLAKDLGHFDGRVCVTNLGVDGFTVPSLNRLWRQRCLSLKPDLLTILIGVNDLAVIKNTGLEEAAALASFKAGYENLIQQIRVTTDCPILLMEPFIFPQPMEYILWQPLLRRMSEMIRQIASDYHLTFLPLWDTLLEAAAKEGIDEITTDGIHLTQNGHRLLADAWRSAYESVLL